MSRAAVCESIDVEGDRTVSVEIDGDWKKVDAALRTLAQRRGALDAEEAQWLRAAAKVKIWRELGFVSLVDYLEHRLGYAPRTAHERIRVALALGALPAMEKALANGMPFSAIRELTRIATPDTEQAWLDDCRGKTVHEIEQRVSGRLPGSSPDEPARPDLSTRPLTFEALKPTTLGMIREARAKAQTERGHQLSDDELLALVFGAFLEGNAAEPTVARYQVATLICEHCSQGWRDAHGRRYAMDRSEVERALCDAQHIGSLTEPRARAVQDIAPRTRRFVWRRDGGRCRVPGCRSAAHLELHHIVPRSLGGTHEAENLIVLCDGCHSAHHRSLIQIRGASSALVVERVERANGGCEEIEKTMEAASVEAASMDAASIDAPLEEDLAVATSVETDPGEQDRDANEGTDGRRHRAPCASSSVGASKASPLVVRGRDSAARVGTNPRQAAGVSSPISQQVPHAITKHAARTGARLAPGRFEVEAIRADARAALLGLGFRRSEAAAAVDLALTRLGSAATLESVIREALRSTAKVKPTSMER